MITLSIRETRLVVERLLQAEGLPLGAVPAVRDYVLLAQASGLDALAPLAGGLSAADREHGGAVTATAAEGGALAVDCRGQSAVVVAPALLDLALASAPGETAELRARGVQRPELLVALAELGPIHRAGIAVAIAGGDGRDVVTVTVTATRAAAPTGADVPGSPPAPLDTLVALTGSAPMARAVHDGLPVPETLWWDLFGASSRALSAETIASLKHAGATAVSDSGEIVPDVTDDDDFGVPAAPADRVGAADGGQA